LLLPAPQLRVLGLLYHTYHDPRNSGAPLAAEFRALLDALLSRLPPADADSVRGTTLGLDLESLAPALPLPAALLDRLEYAVRHRHLIRFAYRSPSEPTPEAVVFTVAPEEQPIHRSHHYLVGWSVDDNTRRWFRVDRIEAGTLEVLGTVLPPGPVGRAPRPIRVRF
jgi:predicted DNA-binding transcriptional regulator YafY